MSRGNSPVQCSHAQTPDDYMPNVPFSELKYSPSPPAQSAQHVQLASLTIKKASNKRSSPTVQQEPLAKRHRSEVPDAASQSQTVLPAEPSQPSPQADAELDLYPVSVGHAVDTKDDKLAALVAKWIKLGADIDTLVQERSALFKLIRKETSLCDLCRRNGKIVPISRGSYCQECYADMQV